MTCPGKQSIFQYFKELKLNRHLLQKIVLLYCLILVGQIFANTGGIIGVISPRLMYDGRPILWQNLDSDSSATSVVFFQGELYNFFGLMTGDDSSRIYAGVNTAGFAVVYSSNSESDDSEAVLIKQALGACGRLSDFDRLMENTTLTIGANSSFACLDAFGGLKLYESNSTVLDPFDLKTSPHGFLVRANFHFAGAQTADEQFWRYHRANEILKVESAKRKLHHHVIVKKCARDVASIAFEPYPLPYSGNSGNAPAGYIGCANSINRFNTVSAVVIHGVRAGEDPNFATMWVVLGEPICGIAVPLWPATSQVPIECRNSENSMNKIFLQKKNLLYDLASEPQVMDTKKLVALRAEMDPIENIIFVETRKALSRWREHNDYLPDMIDFQTTTAAHVVESLSK